MTEKDKILALREGYVKALNDMLPEVAREDEFDWCGTGHHENCNVHDEDIARSRHYAQKPCNCHDWRERNAADFPQMNGEKP